MEDFLKNLPKKKLSDNVCLNNFEIDGSFGSLMHFDEIINGTGFGDGLASRFISSEDTGFGDGIAGYVTKEGVFGAPSSSYNMSWGVSVLSFDSQKIYYINDNPIIISSIDGNIAKGFCLQRDLTLKACFIVKDNYSYACEYTLDKAFQLLKEIK